MSEIIGVSPRQYIDLEKSKRTPTFKTFVNSVLALNINANEYISAVEKDGFEVEDYYNSLEYSQKQK